MTTNNTIGLNANEAIYEAIRQISHHKMLNPHSNAWKHTNKISGFVIKIHDDPSDELCGTVDVQEYNTRPEDRQEVTGKLPVGVHTGVYLSAIQNNKNGIYIIPTLYSDVVIVTDPDSLRKYVIEYSHAEEIQLDAHSKISIGVTETEEFKEDENSPDYDELEPTGKRAHTTYTPDEAVTEVASDDSKASTSKIVVKADSILSEHDKAQILLDAQQILAKYNAKEIVIKEDGVYLGSGSASEPGVLGNQLATLLVDWLGALSQMMTPTMMGPQPPANLAKFVSLQAKVNSYKAAISGFLSKTVKVAE